MIHAIKKEATTKYNLIMFGALFVIFMSLYVFLDFEGNTNYIIMTNNFGLGITLIHILINGIIAVLTSIMVGFSIINYKLTNVEPVGSNAIPFVTFIFGILTFGCTSCVVAFLGAIGIAFTPLILPNGNLLWKVLALLIVVLGFIWIMYSIQHSKCKIKQ
ncbi:hypothetical protein [Candidatus Xianfuyuplasma coldseepsis]|uniref:Uncharacterized protein n=1 Tax=Candidatus Xianfuyuplasma coldseepsis TaxID=2782163 RepID=A0A7L7KNK4_9MOLU|nr:hypothetical protein [Xianfuyuplasma coldseepsis]QMS84207.1 hypothetical protein G4Z02_00105 [Xianfuyuplasma coldseepsis]